MGFALLCLVFMSETTKAVDARDELGIPNAPEKGDGVSSPLRSAAALNCSRRMRYSFDFPDRVGEPASNLPLECDASRFEGVFSMAFEMAGFTRINLSAHGNPDLVIRCHTGHHKVVSTLAHRRQFVQVFTKAPLSIGITNKLLVAQSYGHRKDTWHVYPPTFVLHHFGAIKTARFRSFVEAACDQARRSGHPCSWLLKQPFSHEGGGVTLLGKNLSSLASAVAESNQPLLLQRVVPNLDRIKTPKGSHMYHLRVYVALMSVGTATPPYSVLWAPWYSSELGMGKAQTITAAGTKGGASHSVVTNFELHRDWDLVQPVSRLLRHYNATGRLLAWHENLVFVRDLLARELAPNSSLMTGFVKEKARAAEQVILTTKAATSLANIGTYECLPAAAIHGQPGPSGSTPPEPISTPDGHPIIHGVVGALAKPRRKG